MTSTARKWCAKVRQYNYGSQDCLLIKGFMLDKSRTAKKNPLHLRTNILEIFPKAL